MMNKTFKFVCSLVIAVSMLFSMAVLSAAVGEESLTESDTTVVEGTDTTAEDTTAEDTTTEDTTTENTTAEDTTADTTEDAYSQVTTEETTDATDTLDTSDSVSDTTSAPVELTGIAFSKDIYMITIGEACTTAIIFSPEGASASKITYAIDDTNIATVDENGVITGVAVGNATITATCGEFTCTADIAVSELSLKEEQDPETSETFVIGFAPKTTVADAKDLFALFKGADASTFSFTNGSSAAADGDKLVTGMTVTDALGAKYTVVIMGDVDADGEITYFDTRVVVNSLASGNFANAACKKAANFASEEVLSIRSALAISDYISNKI